MHMKTYSPNREERAFLYQEAQDLEPMLKGLGSLSLLVEEIAAKGNRKTPLQSRFRVTFVVAPESVDMKVQATGKNIYDATIAAKEETLRHLNAIVNSMPRQESREQKNAKPPTEFLH